METEVFSRYELTGGQRAKTVRTRNNMDCCERELLGVVMNAFVMTVVGKDGPERERGSVMMKGNNMSAVY